MVLAGAFDSFAETPRHVFFHNEPGTQTTFLEKIIQYGHKYQADLNSSQGSLFGDLGPVELPDPEIPMAEPWSQLETLKRENEVVGFYLSGHPLDEYKLEMQHFSNASIKSFEEIREQINRTLQDKTKLDSKGNPKADELKRMIERTYIIAGIITIPASTSMTTKNGKPYGRYTVEDYSGSVEISMFGDEFEKYKNLLSRKDQYVLLKVIADRPYYRKEGEYELKVTGVELLSEVLDKYTKRIDLSLKLYDLSSSLVDELKQTIRKNTGKTPLYLQVVDETNEVLHLTLNNANISPRGFMHDLKNHEELSLRLVK